MPPLWPPVPQTSWVHPCYSVHLAGTQIASRNTKNVKKTWCSLSRRMNVWKHFNFDIFYILIFKITSNRKWAHLFWQRWPGVVWLDSGSSCLHQTEVSQWRTPGRRRRTRHPGSGKRSGWGTATVCWACWRDPMACASPRIDTQDCPEPLHTNRQLLMLTMFTEELWCTKYRWWPEWHQEHIWPILIGFIFHISEEKCQKTWRKLRILSLIWE